MQFKGMYVHGWLPTHCYLLETPAHATLLPSCVAGEGQAIRGRVGGALSVSIRKRVFSWKIIGGGLLCQETITRAAFCLQLILEEATRGLR